MTDISAMYISHMGCDMTIVNAARVSFDKEENLFNDIPPPRDSKLINYLADNNHWTPFAHPQITLRETVPIFVARQRFKHMVGFTYNEISRRYVSDEPDFYYPEVWRGKPEGSIKQGSAGVVTKLVYDHGYREDGVPIGPEYEEFIDNTIDFYNTMLKSGVAPEMARMVLPQSMMTSYYVTGSLAAFARMVKQRKDPHAQLEIQDLAKKIEAVIEPLYPVSWAALTR